MTTSAGWRFTSARASGAWPDQARCWSAAPFATSSSAPVRSLTTEESTSSKGSQTVAGVRGPDISRAPSVRRATGPAKRPRLGRATCRSGHARRASPASSPHRQTIPVSSWTGTLRSPRGSCLLEHRSPHSGKDVNATAGPRTRGQRCAAGSGSRVGSSALWASAVLARTRRGAAGPEAERLVEQRRGRQRPPVRPSLRGIHRPWRVFRPAAAARSPRYRQSPRSERHRLQRGAF